MPPELQGESPDLWRLPNANTRSAAAGIRAISPAGKLASALECARRREDDCCYGMFALDSEAAHVRACSWCKRTLTALRMLTRRTQLLRMQMVCRLPCGRSNDPASRDVYSGESPGLHMFL